MPVERVGGAKGFFLVAPSDSWCGRRSLTVVSELIVYTGREKMPAYFFFGVGVIFIFGIGLECRSLNFDLVVMILEIPKVAERNTSRRWP